MKLSLQYAPETDHYYYWNRKKNYAINGMFCCTDNCRITYMCIGDTSTVHDNRVLEQFQLHLVPQRFFTGDEYLMGDSAYIPTCFLIPPYKGCDVNRTRVRQFNATLSSKRTEAIECTFGLLKARFPILVGCNVRIKDK